MTLKSRGSAFYECGSFEMYEVRCPEGVCGWAAPHNMQAELLLRCVGDSSLDGEQTDELGAKAVANSLLGLYAR